MAVDCRSKLERSKDRDVSEKIALGLPTGAPSQDSLFDQRLFNQSKVRLQLTSPPQDSEILAAVICLSTLVCKWCCV